MASPQPEPLGPVKNPTIERKIRNALVRCVGEQQISYRVEELTVMARYAAHAVHVHREDYRKPAGRPPGWTDLDVQILRLLAYGLSYAEIARKTHQPRRMVNARVPELFQRLGVQSRVQAVAAGYECGLLRPKGVDVGAPGGQSGRGRSAGASKRSASLQEPSGAVL